MQESIAHYRIDGSTSGDERQKLIERFNAADNDDVHVFLISTKAGVYKFRNIYTDIYVYSDLYVYS